MEEEDMCMDTYINERVTLNQGNGGRWEDEDGG